MGRGSSKAGGGKTFTNEQQFENSLTGFDDPRLKQYTDAYSEESKYTTTLKNNMEQSMRDDGYDEIREAALSSELKFAQKAMDEMPSRKTPEQLGHEKALKERVDVVNDLMDKNKKLTPGENVADGVKIKDINDPNLRNAMRDIVDRNLRRAKYTYRQSERDGKVIEKATETGDAFVYTNRNGEKSAYTKAGKNDWVLPDGDRSESDGMARIISSLDFLGGSWTFRAKKKK